MADSLLRASWGDSSAMPNRERGALPEVPPVERHQDLGRAVDRGVEHHLVRRVVQLRTPQEPSLDGFGRDVTGHCLERQRVLPQLLEGGGIDYRLVNALSGIDIGAPASRRADFPSWRRTRTSWAGGCWPTSPTG